MKKEEKKKNPKKIEKHMKEKLVVSFAVILLAFVGLGLRLVKITMEDGARYTKQVLSQQEYDSTTLPFRRGDIVDAQGTKLAVSEKVYNLVIDSKVIMSDVQGKTPYYEPTMTALGEHFDLDMNAIREYVKTHTSSSYYVPLKQLTYDEKSGFEAAKEASDVIKGVWFEEEYKRIYPMGSLAADVIGFTGKDNTGTYGLEEYYNEVLNGTTGREYGYLNDDSSLERTIKPAVDGYTIHTTIDVNIQDMIEDALCAFNERNKNTVRTGNGAENVGCILMEVDTGKILGMASYPTFDLNNPRDTSALLGNVLVDEIGNKVKPTTYITEDILATLEGDHLYQNYNYLWKNFCIADTYEPGSVAKPFTVATALETGAITGDEVYNCNGKLHIGGHDISCHITWGDGPVTVEDSIAWSCNVALMEIAQATGKANFAKFQQIFNFGLKTNIDSAGEARTAGLLFDVSMGDADLATNSFGQNFNTTMIQVITGFCSLINGGNYYEPHLVDKITTSGGATVENIEPRVLRQTVSESTSEKIVQYCNAVVMRQNDNKITGRTARPAGYAIGGKTGTAETLPRDNKEYVVSFIGYAPADDPQIAIYVVVDRPNAEKQDDAKFATGIVREVLTNVLPYLNIFMTEELSEAEQQELADRKAELTNMYAPTPTVAPEETTGETSPESATASPAP